MGVVLDGIQVGWALSIGFAGEAIGVDHGLFKGEFVESETGYAVVSVKFVVGFGLIHVGCDGVVLFWETGNSAVDEGG